MLNPNIILAGRGVEINNPMDVAVKGMQLKQLSQQSQLADRALQDDQAMRDAYSKNITKGADGKMSLNRQGMMTSLGPKQAFDFQKLMQGQDLEKMAADTKISGQLAFSVQDEPTYFQARAKALEIGLPNADKLPEQYSPMIVQRWQMVTMSGQEQIAKALADQKLGYQKEQDVLAQENKDRDHRLAVQKLQMEKGKDGARAGQNEGIKALDKDYAKDFNDFTGGGRVKAQDAIAKLKGWKTQLEGDSGFFQAGGGPISGSLPDAVRTEASISQRDNIVSSANSALKSTFGGQLSDGERKAMANEFYNDKLSNAQNVKIMTQKIMELESGLTVQEAKAKWFSQNNTLRGMPNSFEKQSQPTTPQASMLKTNQIEWID